jgi:hypothetical protein
MSPWTGWHVSRVWYGPVLAFAFFCGMILAQHNYDALVHGTREDPKPTRIFVLPALIVKASALGFHAPLADYYWIQVVQSALKWNGKDTFYPEYFHVISELDARFAYPYLFAILTIPNQKNPEALGYLPAIVKRGREALPDDWKIPFYAAVQMHVIGKDSKTAVSFLEEAIHVPSAPDLVKRTHAIYVMRDATDYGRARALFATLAETSDNEETQKIAEERLAVIDLMEVLRVGVGEYRRVHGEYPKDVTQLLSGRESGELLRLIKKYKPQIDDSGIVTLR